MTEHTASATRTSTPRLRRRALADLRPDSLNTESREVEAVVATNNPVPVGSVSEVLDMAGVDLGEFNRGAPVLKDHRRSVDSTVGAVVPQSTRVENGKLIARLRLAEGQAWELVRDGFVSQVSVGFVANDVSERRGENGEPQIVVTSWAPKEVSLVPLGLDPASRIRGEAGADGGEAADPIGLALMARRWGFDDLATRALEGELASQRALGDEILRRKEKTDMETPTEPHTETRPGDHDPVDAFRTAAGDAIAARLAGRDPETTAGRDAAGLGLPEMAREMLRLRGEAVTTMAQARIVERAFNTTSDFQNVLLDAANKVAAQAYRARQTPLRRVARESDLNDFRPQHRVRVGQPPQLKPVNEHGEVTRGSTADTGEVIQLRTYSRIFALTRQVIINDDLALFGDFINRITDAAVSLEARLLADVLLNNPALSDGTPLFDATEHNNVVSTSQNLDVAGLSEARKLLRKQSDLSSDEPLNLDASFIVVNSDSESDAEKLVTSITPATTGDVNPFANRLAVLTEPRLDSETAFWVFAAPQQAPVLEIGFLGGVRQPVVETRQGFDIDGLEVKVRHDVGAAPVDFRGAVRVPLA